MQIKINGEFTATQNTKSNYKQTGAYVGQSKRRLRGHTQ